MPQYQISCDTYSETLNKMISAQEESRKIISSINRSNQIEFIDIDYIRYRDFVMRDLIVRK